MPKPKNESVATVDVDTHLWGITAVDAIATKRIYLTGSGNSKLWMIDEKTNAVTSVATGQIPCAVAVDAVAKRVYVANYGSDSVTVIDAASDAASEKVIATVQVGNHPQAVAVDSGAHRAYVANTRDDSVSVIDGTLNRVIATVKTGKAPYAIAVDREMHRAYVATMAGGVTVIDGRTLAAAPAAPAAAASH